MVLFFPYVPMRSISGIRIQPVNLVRISTHSVCLSPPELSQTAFKFDKEILNIGCPGSRSSLTQNFLVWRFFCRKWQSNVLFGHAPVAVVVVCLIKPRYPGLELAINSGRPLYSTLWGKRLTCVVGRD